MDNQVFFKNESKIHDSISQQVSSVDKNKNNILSVLTKKTYKINGEGQCIAEHLAIPLNTEIIFYKDCPNLLQHDIDIFPIKLYTDVIIKGHACTSKPSVSFESIVQIGNYQTSFRLIGKRKAYKSQDGNIRFTKPELIEQIPLRYDFAYGGKDSVAEKRLQIPPKEITQSFSKDIDWLSNNLYRYPRNPLGKGYLVELNNESLELLELPNIEDPEFLLTPENIIVKDPFHWMDMPLPRCTDWVNPSWFPRIAYLGVLQYEKREVKQLSEIQRCWVDEELLQKKAIEKTFNFRFTNGASLGLQLPFIHPGEKIGLINIHPKIKDFILQLPNDHPKIWIDGRKGKLIETIPVIHTVVIEPDENRLSIVWRGSGPALRPYHDEELKTMPFKVEWK